MSPNPMDVAETYRVMQQIRLKKEEKINVLRKSRDNGASPSQELPGDPGNAHLGKEIDGHV
ncbi:hypothetical protein L9W92_14695 [Pelotomaculum terephthalicicum JT]|uniref:hypothetical protein n=1 Tax=Pelotomaculum TaxID=191373 RepID=UPI0009CC5FFD|nr:MULTISPECIES: hypothetical protein [Pelotomaculum]MCG9969269.1 hypothetical protein [Pelotomaculum terephthalicicum JT]OPX89802.1 MAG: hypothetical protein A4E54_00828 [Pelotomaculum sp. PtaB.Bin117]OPY60739.1 MAG: hypothetical protein A4E56_02503 [Pelotomaculum sp. PtaU1.Bin065]